MIRHMQSLKVRYRYRFAIGFESKSIILDKFLNRLVVRYPKNFVLVGTFSSFVVVPKIFPFVKSMLEGELSKSVKVLEMLFWKEKTVVLSQIYNYCYEKLFLHISNNFTGLRYRRLRKSPILTDYQKLFQNFEFTNYIFVDETTIRLSERPIYHLKYPAKYPANIPSTSKYEGKLNIWAGISFKGATNFAASNYDLDFKTTPGQRPKASFSIVIKVVIERNGDWSKIILGCDQKISIKSKNVKILKKINFFVFKKKDILKFKYENKLDMICQLALGYASTNFADTSHLSLSLLHDYEIGLIFCLIDKPKNSLKYSCTFKALRYSGDFQNEKFLGFELKQEKQRIFASFQLEQYMGHVENISSEKNYLRVYNKTEGDLFDNKIYK
ncbi:hypothetical protein BpHYR1_040666 [Brachionus plicatilis]|uniref:Uncharacterized protein n=1 Tax=Brachionus plicatilis TaxID=10195 RepID=A0A3M7RMW0_BRAPC|nr:hypothetical protein BpHYR1_040666 [Brachionus plicatilis]